MDQDSPKPRFKKLEVLFEELQNQDGKMYLDEKGEWQQQEKTSLW